MVSDTILGAAIGVGGAVVGSVLTGLFNLLSTRQRVQAENTRRHSELYLERKVEMILELSSRLWEAQDWVAIALVQRASDEEYNTLEKEDKVDPEEDLYPLIIAFQRSITDTTIFLDEEQETILRNCVDILWDAYSLIKNEEEIEERHVEGILETTKIAREMLQEEIKDPAERLEPN